MELGVALPCGKHSCRPVIYISLVLFLGSAGTLSDSISLQAAGGSGFDVKCSLPRCLTLYTL